jgi:hypothetical protein
MGTFDYPPPQGDVKFISDHHKVEIFQVSSFRMTYFNDPWILPSPSATMEGTGHPGMSMPLSTAEVAYSLVQQASADTDPTPAQELDPILEPIWAQGSLTDTNSLDLVLPSDEAIIEAMTSPNKPWDDLHHRSYFLPELSRIEAREFTLTMTGDRSCPINPLATHEVLLRVIWKLSLKPYRLISPEPLALWRIRTVFFGSDCSPNEAHKHKVKCQYEIQIYTDLGARKLNPCGSTFHHKRGSLGLSSG